MASSEQDYMTDRSKQIQRKQRLLAVVSIASFVGSGVFGASQLFSGAFQQVSQDAKSEYKESPLKVQERGYELVLQREPENQVALEALVSARLQMKDGKGAIAPLEKLVKLYPDRADYKMLLAQLRQQLGER